MQTKLPSLIGVNKEVDQAMRVKHDAEKDRQKRYADKKRKAKEKQIKMGDEILIQQKKLIHGSKVLEQRSEEVKTRAKNNIKLVKKRPACLQVRGGRRHNYKEKEEADIDIDLEHHFLVQLHHSPVLEINGSGFCLNLNILLISFLFRSIPSTPSCSLVWCSTVSSCFPPTFINSLKDSDSVSVTTCFSGSLCTTGRFLSWVMLVRKRKLSGNGVYGEIY